MSQCGSRRVWPARYHSPAVDTTMSESIQELHNSMIYDPAAGRTLGMMNGNAFRTLELDVGFFLWIKLTLGEVTVRAMRLWSQRPARAKK